VIDTSIIMDLLVEHDRLEEDFILSLMHVKSLRFGWAFLCGWGMEVTSGFTRPLMSYKTTVRGHRGEVVSVRLVRGRVSKKARRNTSGLRLMQAPKFAKGRAGTIVSI
jgi:hypothetical protein